MTTTQANADKSKAATKPADTAKAKAPEIDTSGWDEANVNIDGWYAPETTGRLVGRAVEAIKVNSEYGEQDVVLVKSATVANVIQGKGNESKVVELPVGSIVAVRISANLAMLLELVEHQCAVEITPQGQVPLKGGKKMWRYGVKFKGTRAQLSRKASTNESARGDTNDDDQLPF